MTIYPLTIHEVLTRTNPALRINSSRGDVTKNRKWQELERHHIREWKEFTYENMVAAYDDVLQRGPIAAPFEDEVSNSQRNMKMESSVDTISMKWNNDILRYPLKEGLKHWREITGVKGEKERYNVTFKLHELNVRDPVSRTEFKPDLAIFLEPLDEKAVGGEIPVVFGDNKCSTKLHSSFLTRDVTTQGEFVWTMRQVATYGLCGGTRYTFVLTPEEMIAVRVYRDERDFMQLRVEQKSVPWGNEGEGVLTVNLAIWWLAMMALNEPLRDIVVESQMLPINVWCPDGAGFEHHISKRRVDKLPRGQVALAPKAAATPKIAPPVVDAPPTQGSKRTRRR